MSRNYDILFVSEAAIGNTLEMLYALEYCLVNGVNAAICLKKINRSFEVYLKRCYGENAVLSSLDGVRTTNLVHPFIVEERMDIPYRNYFYIHPDAASTRYQSETEQYLSVARALYPSDYHSDRLTMLQADLTDRVRALELENKYVFYPGCSSFASAKRWPYFRELAEALGDDKVIFVGGSDDLNYESSYSYRPWVGKLLPYRLTNRKSVWQLCKKLKLLRPYAHNTGIEEQENSYFNVFDWGELVAIFKGAKGFVGNDGGLMHLAAAAGAKGVAIFGPSSVEKNRAYSPSMEAVHTDYDCQPCQFSVKNVFMARNYIACPYDMKCLKDIAPGNVIDRLGNGQ